MWSICVDVVIESIFGASEKFLTAKRAIWAPLHVSLKPTFKLCHKFERPSPKLSFVTTNYSIFERTKSVHQPILIYPLYMQQLWVYGSTFITPSAKCQKLTVHLYDHWDFWACDQTILENQDMSKFILILFLWNKSPRFALLCN